MCLLAGCNPDTLLGLSKRLSKNILDVFDLEAMCIRLVEADKALVVDMFQKIGDNELRVIENSGFWHTCERGEHSGS